MTVLILKALVLGVGLVLAVYGLARFLHAVLYTEIPADLYWRAPAAAGIMWLLTLALPAGVDYSGGFAWPVTFADIFLVTGDSEVIEFDYFLVPGAGDKQIRYDRRKTPRGVEYRDSQDRPLPASVTRLIGVARDGRKYELEVVRDAEGYIDRSRGGSPRFRTPEGLEMTGEDFGRIRISSPAPVFASAIAFLWGWGVWMACAALLLELQLGHAIGYSLVGYFCWIAVLGFVWP